MKRQRDPIRWPDGARIAITPCVAFETWPEDLGAAGSLQQENRRSFPKTAVTKKNLGSITDREFGERVGVFRMLELFQKEGIRTTFFPTGITIKNYPDVFKEIVTQGHEIGTETWIHDYSYMKKRDKEKQDLKKTVKIVEEVVGYHPQGYLSTGVAPSDAMPEIILELGYNYWMDYDDRPSVFSSSLTISGSNAHHQLHRPGCGHQKDSSTPGSMGGIPCPAGSRSPGERYYF